LSRIISGPSSEVQDWKMDAGGARRTRTGHTFLTGKVDGTFSKVELEQAMEKARQEGRQQGVAEAEKRLTQPLQTALQNLEGVLDEVSRFRRELFKEAEVEVIELVRYISKKVLGKELSLNADLLKDLVEKGLEIVEREKQLSIQFNPADLKTFQKAKQDFLQKFSTASEMRFMADSNIPAGTAMIRTENIQVDVDVQKMVDHLLEQVQQSKMSDREANDEGDKT